MLEVGVGETFGSGPTLGTDFRCWWERWGFGIGFAVVAGAVARRRGIGFGFLAELEVV